MDTPRPNVPFNTNEPILESWLAERFPDGQWESLGRHALYALPIAAWREGGTLTVPSAIISAWQRAIAWNRRTSDESESSLIAKLFQQGGSWEDVANLLGLEDERAAQESYGNLIIRLKSRPFESGRN